jgi:glycosyltransferase involved in cell wall biosynthesis
MRTVCLISSAHVSANPRLVKEADALSEADYQVTVIAANVNRSSAILDRSVLKARRWQFIPVERGSLISYSVRTLTQRLVRWLLPRLRSPGLTLSTIAHHRLSHRLARAANSVAADLYIAHNLAALPAAFHAATRNGGRLGFDGEDFHVEEVDASQRDRGDQIARRVIEEKLLPRCDYLTCASPMIAAAYEKQYDVKMLPVLNVFPKTDAPTHQISRAERIPRSLYWFSQTIGRGRGLEKIIRALGHMADPAAFYLRGNPASGYKENLMKLAGEYQLQDKIHFLDPAMPDELVRLSQYYSIGLAPELNEPLNRAICLTNKIFVYLLAGLPILMSRTPAQIELSKELDNAVLLVDLNSPKDIAQALTTFLAGSDAEERARRKAWTLAQERYNWDVEKDKFLEHVSAALH